MINDIRYSRFDGKPVEAQFGKSFLAKVQSILEVFQDDFINANGFIEAYIKDDFGSISITIECDDPNLKELMYQALKPYYLF